MINFKKLCVSIPNLKETCITWIICGIFAHLFALTNVIHNYDNMAVLPNGYGTGLNSGRWLLTVFGNLLLYVFLILRVLYFLHSGGIFIVSPPVTSMLFFMYTAPYYAFAVLLAIMAVWIINQYKFGFLAAVVMCACSLGIYQAYFPMTIPLFVALLIRDILKQNSEIGMIFRKGILYNTADK